MSEGNTVKAYYFPFDHRNKLQIKIYHATNTSKQKQRRIDESDFSQTYYKRTT